MGWIISRDNDGRQEYLRKITPRFVSWAIDRADARRFATRKEARDALKGRGFSVTRAAPDEGAS